MRRQKAGTGGRLSLMGVSRRERAVWLGVLVVIFLGSVGFVLWRWPLELGLTVALLVVAGASAAILSAYYLPNHLDERLKRAGTVGAGCIALIAAVLAAGALLNPPKEPLTATLGLGAECKNFAVPTDLLPSIPPNAEPPAVAEVTPKTLGWLE
jgi:MFS family permease